MELVDELTKTEHIVIWVSCDSRTGSESIGTDKDESIEEFSNIVGITPPLCYNASVFSLHVVSDRNTRWLGELLWRFLFSLCVRPILLPFSSVQFSYLLFQTFIDCDAKLMILYF